MGTRNAIRLTKTAIEQAKLGTQLRDIEVPGFKVVISPKGMRTFKYQYRTREGYQGAPKIGCYPVMTVDEARKIARQYAVEVAKGGHPSRDLKKEREAPTLAYYVTYYCEEYGPQKGFQASTIRDAKRVLDRYALPRYGTRKIAEVSTRDVLAIVAKARDDGSVAQANRLRAALSRICTLAMRDDVLVRNPVSGVEKYPEEVRTVRLGHAEVARFLKACDAYHDQEIVCALLLLLHTGARKNEVLKAEWSQFDLENATRTKPIGHVKSKRTHMVLLAPQSVAILKKMEASRSTEFLFPGRKEGKARYDLKGPWAAIRDAAGLKGYRPHDLRRTLASFMISTNSDIATVGKALGQSQAQTTQRYAMMFPRNQQDGNERAIAAQYRFRSSYSMQCFV